MQHNNNTPFENKNGVKFTGGSYIGTVANGAFCFCGSVIRLGAEQQTAICAHPHCEVVYPIDSVVSGKQSRYATIANITRGVLVTDRDMNGMSELQHLMVKLGSECSELSHAVLKGVEFGINHTYPGTTVTILDKIEAEFNDVLGCIRMLKKIGYPIQVREELIDAKETKVTRMMEVAREYGVLSRYRIPTAERVALVEQRIFNTELLNGVTLVGNSSKQEICEFIVSHPEIDDGLRRYMQFANLTYPHYRKELEYYRAPDDGSESIILRILCSFEEYAKAEASFYDWVTDQDGLPSVMDLSFTISLLEVNN